MIPLYDDVPSRRTPVVNVALLVLTTIVFLTQLLQEPGAPDLIERFGMIPARVVDPDVRVLVPEIRAVRVGFRVEERLVQRPAAPSAVPAWLTLLTCIFLHGGWLHFLGNMWFLWIFGDNVEDRLGHAGYLGFYLATGVAASLMHLVVNLGSGAPTIGASGAIAGVMGAYFVLYPRARVVTLVPLFVFLYTIVLPAPVFLGVWFLIQFYQGTLAAGASGVAWWAHIGGFVAGTGLALVLRARDRRRPTIEVRRPGSDEVVRTRWRPPRRGFWR